MMRVHIQSDLDALRRDYGAIAAEWADVAQRLRERKFDPGQPRIPGGSPGGGQFTFGRVLAQAGLKLATRLSVLTSIAALYLEMSKRNDANHRAAAVFKSREYPISERELDLGEVRNLERDETRRNCPRLEEVQSRTNAAAEVVSQTRPGLPPAEYGTAVHENLKQQIRALDDPNFRAEVSFLKGERETYGKSGTVRVDVYERIDAVTACVYDIKTGYSGLSPARMREIAQNVGTLFGPVGRVIITEVRPMR